MSASPLYSTSGLSMNSYELQADSVCSLDVKSKSPLRKPLFTESNKIENLLAEYQSINPFQYSLDGINWDNFSKFILKRSQKRQLRLPLETPKTVRKPTCRTKVKSLSPNFKAKQTMPKKRIQRQSIIQPSQSKTNVPIRRKSAQCQIFGNPSEKQRKLNLEHQKTIIQQHQLQQRAVKTAINIRKLKVVRTQMYTNKLLLKIHQSTKRQIKRLVKSCSLIDPKYRISRYSNSVDTKYPHPVDVNKLRLPVKLLRDLSEIITLKRKVTRVRRQHQLNDLMVPIYGKQLLLDSLRLNRNTVQIAPSILDSDGSQTNTKKFQKVKPIARMSTILKLFTPRQTAIAQAVDQYYPRSKGRIVTTVSKQWETIRKRSQDTFYGEPQKLMSQSPDNQPLTERYRTSGSIEKEKSFGYQKSYRTHTARHIAKLQPLPSQSKFQPYMKVRNEKTGILPGFTKRI